MALLQRIFLFILCFNACYLCFGQEICNNGIDDDGDGLIDLEDNSDCNCNVFIYEEIVGDFEFFSCCPQDATGLSTSAINCLVDGWQTPSRATTDYVNECDYIGAGDLPEVSLPLPSGSGAIGFGAGKGGPDIVGVELGGGGGPGTGGGGGPGTGGGGGGPIPEPEYSEHIAYCLPNRLVVDETYDLSFYLSFNEDTYPSVTLSLFGTNSCENLNSDISSCMTSDQDWYEITTININFDASNPWVFANTSFIATEDTKAIAIGTTCAYAQEIPGWQYFYIDLITLSGTYLDESANFEHTINITGDCISGVSLDVPFIPEATYQWYYENAAVVGAIENSYDVPVDEQGIYTVLIDYGTYCGILQEVNVKFDLDVLEINGITQDLKCADTLDGFVDIEPPLENLPLEFNWSNGTSTEDIFDIGPGNYTVTVTDDNGCYGIEDFQVNSPIDIQAALYLEQPVNGNLGRAEVFVFFGTPPYSLSWSTNANTNVIEELIPGEYSITIIDDNGCQELLEFEIYEELKVNPVITQESCKSSCDATIDLVITGGLPSIGVPKYDVVWGNGEEGSFIDSLCNGIYKYTVTDAYGTEINDSIIIMPFDNEMSLEAFFDKNICSTTDSTSIELVITGGELPLSYLWSNGDTISTNIHAQFGVNQVTIVDANGCIIDTSFMIGLFDPIANEAIITSASCNESNGSINISMTSGSGPFKFEWSTSDISQNLVGINAGTYTLTITDSNNCSSINEYKVNSDSDLDINFDKLDTRCPNSEEGSISLQISGGTGPYDIIWSNGQTTSSITDLEAGSYSVSVTDAQNCLWSQNFEIETSSSINVLEDISNSSCYEKENGYINLQVSGSASPFSYNWSNGTENKDLPLVSNGYYQVTITDNLNCEYYFEYEVEVNEAFSVVDSTIMISCYNANDGEIYLNIDTSGEFFFDWSNGANTNHVKDLESGIYSVTVSDEQDCSQELTFELTNPDELIIEDSISHIGCNGASSGFVKVFPTGGQTPYQYIWDNGSILDSISGLSAGDYTVTVSDTNGCLSTKLFSIEETEPLSVIEEIENISCFGFQNGSISLEANGGQAPYNFQWSTLENTNIIQGLNSGNYGVTVSDDLFCSIELSYLITEPDEIMATENLTQPKCYGESGTLELIISGGQPEYDYIWSNGETSSAIDVFGGIEYIVTITDANNCSLEISKLIDQPDQLTVLPINVIDPGTNGNDGSILIGISGGTEPYEIEWNTGDKTVLLEGLTYDTYTVTVTDGNNCTDSIEIAFDQATLNYTHSIQNNDCFGDCKGNIELIITGGTAPYTVNWSNLSNGTTLNDLCNGVYFATIIDATGQEIITEEFDISSPTNITIDGEVFDISCLEINDGKIIAQASGGTTPYSYEWNNQLTSNEISQLEPGSYELEVTDDNGCSGTESFTIEDIPLISMEVEIHELDCTDLTYSARIIGDNNYSYPILLNDQEVNIGSDGQVWGLVAGEYTLSYMINDNCIIEVDKLLVEEPALYDLSFDTDSVFVEFESILPLSIEVSFDFNITTHTIDWSTTNQIKCIEYNDEEQCISIEILCRRSETLRIDFIDEYGCLTSFFKVIKVDNKNIHDIPNIFSPNDDSTNDYLNFSFNDNVVGIKQLLIMDRWGSKVFSKSNIPPENNILWDGKYKGKKVSTGVYFYYVEIENRNGSSHILKGDITLIR